MRIDKYVPLRPSQDPAVSGGVHMSFEGPMYDIFLVEGSVFVCRDGYMAVYGPSGTAYVGLESGKGVVEAFNKRFPRESKVKKSER